MSERPLEIDPSQAISVNSVSEEYSILALKRCECEGRFQVRRQTLLTHEDAYYDMFEAVCRQCGQAQSFLFNISGFFGK